MSDTFKTKLGTTKAGERTRIWIEGARLAAVGFTVGKRFKREWSDKTLTLSVCTESQFNELTRAERGTVSGKGDKPIIDVTGAQVAETFSGSHAVVTYSARLITIRNA
ncbi:hypothetical protein [Bradyrhizobium retamae]|uniref:Uncharacterized protein n=1 Tax=Bradyrhizobium retamae TaxID=1300035 RepID=A0A0R3MWP3_9BRAD|nr:hypothetical protein [Bradyrhizobium retamae]KRR21686.1 hypothetical protein CQ13_06445 [Bradyrhizobium retamae]